MQTKQIGIILLIGLLILGVIGSSIPYTESQFFLQNTDINYLSYTQGDYNNSIFLIDKNIITTIPFSDINNALIVSAQDTNFETYGFTVNDINNALIDLTDYVQYTGNANNLDMGDYNVSTANLFTNVVWNDSNNDYGTIYCPDGNIVTGYLVGFSC